METVKVSSKYQIVIPARIRKSLNIQVGQKMSILKMNNHLEVIPTPDVSSMRGFIEGIDTSFEREKDRL